MKIILLFNFLFWFVCFESYASEEIAIKVFPSVVKVTIEDNSGKDIGIGSGFVFQEDLIITNFHVIDEAFSGYVNIVGDKNKYQIEGLIAAEPEYDLAILKIKNFSAKKIKIFNGNSKVGEKIFAIGNPRGFEGTLSDGIISGLREKDGIKYLQITAPISPGSSGGPVVNEKGELVGIVASYFKDSQNINFAIPASYVKQLWENRLTSPESPYPLSWASRIPKKNNSTGYDNIENKLELVCQGIEWSMYEEWASYDSINYLTIDFENKKIFTKGRREEGTMFSHRIFDIIKYDDNLISATTAKEDPAYFPEYNDSYVIDRLIGKLIHKFGMFEFHSICSKSNKLF